MCQLFINADPTLWVSRTRSLRIDGMATSVRIETFFWDLLEEIGRRTAIDGLAITADELVFVVDDFAGHCRQCLIPCGIVCLTPCPQLAVCLCDGGN